MHPHLLALAVVVTTAAVATTATNDISTYNPDECEDRAKCADHLNDCCSHDDWGQPQTCTDGWIPVVTGERCHADKADSKYKCCSPRTGSDSGKPPLL